MDHGTTAITTTSTTSIQSSFPHQEQRPLPQTGAKDPDVIDYHYYRYIPAIDSLSLQSDAPGYYCSTTTSTSTSTSDTTSCYLTTTTNTTPSTINASFATTNDMKSTTTNTTGNDQSNMIGGPICWKCRGTGMIRKNQGNNNDHHNNITNRPKCKVCIGYGYMTSSSLSSRISNNTNTTPLHEQEKISSSSSYYGLITRGRTPRRQQQQVIHDNYYGIEPYGYTIPYYGELVQYATNSCQDIRIYPNNQVINNNNYNKNNIVPSTTTTASPSIRIEIGNMNKKGNTNTKDEDYNVTNDTSNIPTTTFTSTTSKIDIAELPIWVPQQNNEHLCNLVGHWRILQYKKSHCYTTDDVVTAMIALRECFYISQQQQQDNNINNSYHPSSSISYCDLGTGNGSVLQMILWKTLSHNIQFKHVVGIEARKNAVELLKRSLEFNIGYISSRNKSNNNTTTNDNNNNTKHLHKHQHDYIEIIHGDFRNTFFTKQQNSNNNEHCKYYHQFDIITGTPPYFQVDFYIPQTSSLSTATDNSNNNDTTNNDYETNQNDNKNNCNANDTSCHQNDDRDMNGDSTVSSALPHVEQQQLSVTATIRQGGMPLSIQSAPARCEFRGGIEEYCRTAQYLLKLIPSNTIHNRTNTKRIGQFCVCINYLNHYRALDAFQQYGFKIIKCYMITGKIGRCQPLFCVYVAYKYEHINLHDPNNNIYSNDNDDRYKTINEESMESMELHHHEKEEDDGIEEELQQHEHDEPEIIRITVRDENGEYTKEYQHLVLDYMSIIY